MGNKIHYFRETDYRLATFGVNKQITAEKEPPKSGSKGWTPNVSSIKSRGETCCLSHFVLGLADKRRLDILTKDQRRIVNREYLRQIMIERFGVRIEIPTQAEIKLHDFLRLCLEFHDRQNYATGVSFRVFCGITSYFSRLFEIELEPYRTLAEIRNTKKQAVNA